MENFDAMSEVFDIERRVKRAEIIGDAIRAHITDGYKKTALEFGCGTGFVGFQLIDDFDSLLFVDSSLGMIEQVELKLGKLNKPTSSVLCCDLLADIHFDTKFDCIFSSLVLHHIVDTKAILSRLYDLLHTGGQLIIVDLDKDNGEFHRGYPDFDGHNGFEQSVLMKMAQKIGFAKVEAKTFYYGNKMIEDREIYYSLFILCAHK